MNIHPIIDEPPSFPQTVLRLGGSQEALIAVTGARNAGSRFTALANWNAETVDVPTAGNTDAPEPKNTGRNAPCGIT